MEDVYNDDHYLEGDAGPRSSPLLQSVKPDLYPDGSSLEAPSKELSDLHEYDIYGVEQDLVPWPGGIEITEANAAASIDEFAFDDDILPSLDDQRDHHVKKLIGAAGSRETDSLVGEDENVAESLVRRAHASPPIRYDSLDCDSLFGEQDSEFDSPIGEHVLDTSSGVPSIKHHGSPLQYSNTFLMRLLSPDNGGLYTLPGHQRQSTTYNEYSSVREYNSCNAETPIADDSGATPTIEPMGIDSITDPPTDSFQCAYPDCMAQSFQSQYLLNSHANVHNSKRPHYCSVKGCPRSEGGKGFKRKNEMIRHGLVHDSPGYVCPFCPDREHKYPRPDNLQRHVRVHHIDKDKEDAQLLEVLSQRPEGPSRGRRRLVGFEVPGVEWEGNSDHKPKGSLETYSSEDEIVVSSPHIKREVITSAEIDYGTATAMTQLRTTNTAEEEVVTEDPINLSDNFHISNVLAPQTVATDSGYASMGWEHEANEEEDQDDSQTVYTDNQELNVPEDVKEKLAAAFSHELIRELYGALGSWNDQKKARGALEKILKEFAMRCGRNAHARQQEDAVTFIRHYRRRIASLLEKCMKVYSGGAKEDMDDDEVDEETKFWRAQKGLSVEEKMCLWDESEPQISQLSDSLSSSFSKENEQEEFEDYAISHYPDAWKFLTNGHDYQWLLGRVRTEITLTSRVDTVAENIRQEILRGLTSSRPERGHRHTVAKAKFDIICWDISKFLKEHYADQEYPQLGTLITLVGLGMDVQALTCAEYMRQVWPTTGLETLDALQKAFGNGHGNRYKCTTTGRTEIDLVIQRSSVEAVVTGTAPAIAEIGEQLAWLGAALRGAPSDDTMAYCAPEIGISPGATPIFQLSFQVVEFEQPTRGLPNGSCWHPLFRNPIVVRGFPILARFGGERGLEISLNMMAGLGQATRVTNFDGGLVIKGCSSMFYPTQRIQNSVLWHFLVNENGKRMSYLSAEGCRASIHDVDAACLEQSRNFLGWSSSVEIHAGGKDTRYEDIEWAGASLASAGFACEKASIVAGQFVTGGASFVRGTQDTPIYISRGSGPYAQEVHFARNMKVVLYDTKDRRGWLVDGASALLHLTRTQLSSSPYSDSDLFRLEDFNHADPTNGVLAAKKALMDRKNRNMVIFEDVETSTEWKASSGIAGSEPLRNIATRWTYEDLVRQTYHTLEQIHDYQTKMMASPDLGIRFTDREKLIGFGFKDIIDGHNDLLPRVAILKSSGRGWVDFTRSIRAIILLGKGFGEIIKPSKDSNKLCKYWSHVPTGKDYLVACIATLREISLKYGDCDSDPLELASGIYWHKPDKLFESCECKRTQMAGTCDRVQVLLPQFCIGPKRNPQPFSCNNGAAIFGRSRWLRWDWPSTGKPVKGKPPESDSDDENSFPDSGIGESLPSTSDLDSSRNANSSPSDGSPPSLTSADIAASRSRQSDTSLSSRSELISMTGDIMMSGGLMGDDEVYNATQSLAPDHIFPAHSTHSISHPYTSYPEFNSRSEAIPSTPPNIQQLSSRPAMAKRAWDELKDSLQMFPRKKPKPNADLLELEPSSFPPPPGPPNQRNKIEEQAQKHAFDQ